MSAGTQVIKSWLNLLGTSNSLKKSIDSRLKQEFGISISRFDLLAALHRAPKNCLSAGGLTERLLASDGNTTQIAARLLKDGYIQKQQGKKDRRFVIYSLTPWGLQQFQIMAKQHKIWIEQIYAGLSNSDIEQLKDILSKLTPDILMQESSKDAA